MKLILKSLQRSLEWQMVWVLLQGKRSFATLLGHLISGNWRRLAKNVKNDDDNTAWHKIIFRPEGTVGWHMTFIALNDFYMKAGGRGTMNEGQFCAKQRRAGRRKAIMQTFRKIFFIQFIYHFSLLFFHLTDKTWKIFTPSNKVNLYTEVELWWRYGDQIAVEHDELLTMYEGMALWGTCGEHWRILEQKLREAKPKAEKLNEEKLSERAVNREKLNEKIPRKAELDKEKPYTEKAEELNEEKFNEELPRKAELNQEKH